MSAGDKILSEVRAMQAANPGMSYDQAWNAVESRRKALPSDFGAAVLEVQAAHPGMTFEDAWDLVEAEALPFWKKGLTRGQALVLARGQPVVRSPGAPFEVKATTVRSVVEPETEPWPKGKMLLICGSVGTYVA